MCSFNPALSAFYYFTVKVQIFSLIDKVKTGYLAFDKIIFSFGHSKFLFSFPP